jgi:uncharacterized membrane protein (UPF0127 family)
MNKFGIQLIALLAACVILFIIANNLIADHAIPSLGEFMASSTQSLASSTESLASSTESLASSTESLMNEIASTTPVSTSMKIVDLHAPKGVIHVEIADTDALREQGLSDRLSLPAYSGMLFTFDTPGQYGFWMKDMHFPLDMVWINADKTVAGVTKDLSPDTYPTIFPPPNPISYVLEINAGDANKFSLVNGAIVDFTLPPK